MSEMTGLERLRELAGGTIEVSVWMCADDEYSGRHGLSHADEGGPIGGLLSDIADQIEREQVEAAADHAVVASVASEMERHVLGHEGMEDSPVARWARELREALGGRNEEEVTDVATIRKDAYDAYEWVCENGGLDELRRMFQDADSRRVELCAALGIDLDKGWSEAMAAMRLRLVPEGMEWLVEAWPRFEDDAPVRFEDEWCLRTGGTAKVGFRQTPDEFTHQRPVLDANGVPIHEGDTVWCMATNDELTDMNIVRKNWPTMRAKLTVKSIISDSHGDKWADFEETYLYVKTCYLTHTNPGPRRTCQDCRFWQKEPTAGTLGVCWRNYAERDGEDSYEARIEDAPACEYFRERGE